MALLGDRRSEIIQTVIGRTEVAIYLLVAALLVAAAGFTLVGTVVDVIEGADSRQVADTGVFLLDRVLLIFIIAELLYTLRLVNLGGRVLVEPFLFIALIAVVRKVLVITAEFASSRRAAVDFVIQLGALAALALVLAIAIRLLRGSAPGPAPEPS
ncbi:MAG: phosphate-starvation-inducible PsiE family protein [Thermoleophilaceae bacterium]